MTAPAKDLQVTPPAATRDATTTTQQTDAPTQATGFGDNKGPAASASRFSQQLGQNSPLAAAKPTTPAEEVAPKEEAAAQEAPAAVEKEEEKGGVPALRASGLANYEATLGKWLGSKLYGAVASELTLDKLAGHADSALKGAIKGLGGQIKTWDAGVDEGAVNQAVDAAIGQFGKVAGTWVKANGQGLTSALQGWADANPELIVTLALLAAAGAVAANMQIPELAANIGLGSGFDAGVAVKLGRLRDIALEKVEGRLSYKAGDLRATFKGTYEEGKSGVGLDVATKLNPNLDLNAQAGWNQQQGANGRLGLNYKPRKDLDIGAHVGYDQKQGANVGVGVTFRF